MNNSLLPDIAASEPKVGIRAVTIGGGTGSFMLLSSLRHYVGNLTAIVNMSDDGGSTGMLRDELGALPPGDIRQCLVALSNSPTYMRELFNYRFESGNIKGHAFGNLLLSALEKIGGDFASAVEIAEELLQVQGRVLPVTTDNVRVRAVFPNGETVQGEHNLQNFNFSGARPVLSLTPKAQVTSLVKAAIAQADLIVIGPGDLFSSLVPVLIPDGMAEALAGTKARVVYVANLVNKPLTTKGMQVHDYADVIEEYIGKNVLSNVIYNTAEPTKELIHKYMQEGEELVAHDPAELSAKDYVSTGVPLLANGAGRRQGDLLRRNLIRHDGERLARAIMKVYFS